MNGRERKRTSAFFPALKQLTGRDIISFLLDPFPVISCNLKCVMSGQRTAPSLAPWW